MDNIYQSLKALLKSVLNLFLAVVNLFTGLIDGLAAILVKLRPGISSEKGEWKKISKKGKDNEEERLVEEIRIELKQKVTSKEKYYYWNALSSDNGIGFYAIVLSILVFALAGTVMLYSTSSYGEVRVFAAVVMALLCIAACLAIAGCQKRVFRNKLVKQILEKEFSNKLWEAAGEIDVELKSEATTDTDSETEKKEPEKSKEIVSDNNEEKREIAKIQPINVVGKEEIG